MAISVDSPEDSRELLADMKDGEAPFEFPLASDTSKAVVKAFGVYDKANDIALPATFILNKEGEVAWKYIGGSVFDRPEENAIVDELTKLAK